MWAFFVLEPARLLGACKPGLRAWIARPGRPPPPINGKCLKFFACFWTDSIRDILQVLIVSPGVARLKVGVRPRPLDATIVFPAGNLTNGAYASIL